MAQPNSVRLSQRARISTERVAGAAGMDVKETERLCDVATEAEAIDVTIAFVQLYRENAKYLDRPYKWVAKVGLDWVQERIADLDERTRLIAAF